MDDCYYYGCWNRPGRFVHIPNGLRVFHGEIHLFGNRNIHIDCNLAPRRGPDGRIGFAGMVLLRRFREEYFALSSECPHGQFLRHELDNGFTAIQWWDRCQGDTRPGCNSTILLRGIHTSEEMLAALHLHFPHVAANLKAKGVELVEVKAS